MMLKKWLSTIKCKQTKKQNKLSFFVFFQKQKHSSNNNNKQKKTLFMSPKNNFVLSDLVQKKYLQFFSAILSIFSSIFLQLFLSSLKNDDKKMFKKMLQKIQMHLKVAHRGMTLKTIPTKNRKRKKKLRVNSSAWWQMRN